MVLLQISMIKLQSSKKLLKNYDELLTNTLSAFHHTLAPTQHSARQPRNSPTHKQQDHTQSNIEFGKTISKLVKIQFHENLTIRQSQQTKLRRKQLTSAQKFHSKKKNNYSSCVKETTSRTTNQHNPNHTYLTIGTHSIQKIDYTTSLLTKDFILIDNSHSFRNKFKPTLINPTQLKNISSKEKAKVLILRKIQKNRLEDLFKPCKTGRTPNSQKLQQPTKIVASCHPTRNGKTYSIQQFIPIRKNTTKKQPFVFGLNQKQLNPQKHRQKLLAYHDFLWKINYSNGLYIKPSEQETNYKVYIGLGNNSNLIKSILKRRFWWNISDRMEGCNLVWTQLKINSIFKEIQNDSTTIINNLYPNNIEVEENLKTEPIPLLQQGHDRIFNSIDLINWNRHIRKYHRSEGILSQKSYKNRADFLNCKQISRIENCQKVVMHNHLQQNYYIGNKKSLFYHIRKFYQLQNLDVFQTIPLTFHISKGLEDSQFKLLQNYFEELEKKKMKGQDIKNIWIIKPGENSNRGNGITICYSLEEIKFRIKSKEKNTDGTLRTFIIQKYIEKPLLFKGRKFDIRHYLLLTSFNGITKAYWFPQGYIRTSSSTFTLRRGTNLLVHLTNDAIQKHSDQYGKYQKGNKISYQKFQHYLNKTLGTTKKNCFFNNILPQMKQIAIQAVKATSLSLDPHKKQHNFELLGMDFMIDEELRPWLIEINTNPCLQLSSPLLARIIPSLIEQTLRICVDPFFPPPEEWPSGRKMYIEENILQQNKFQLIFDESVDGKDVRSIIGTNTEIDKNMGKIEEDAEIFQNDGVEQWQQKQSPFFN